MSLGDFFSGIGDILATPGNLPAIASLVQGQPSGPGGGVMVGGPSGLVVGQFPTVPTPTGVTAALGAGSCPTFRQSAQRVRATPEIRAVNPSTGKIESWVHRGSPLVWSGDRACAKRYAKHAGFTLKRRGSGSPRRAIRRR